MDHQPMIQFHKMPCNFCNHDLKVHWIISDHLWKEIKWLKWSWWNNERHTLINIQKCKDVPVFNPSVTARVKNSQNVDILPTVYLVHLKVKHCQTRTCSKYLYRSKWVDRFWLVKALSGIVEGGQNDSQNQSKNPLCAHLVQQSKQTVDWFWPL